MHASWEQFAARVTAAAGSLLDTFGLSVGDRVAIVMGNQAKYLEAQYAI